MDKSCFKSNKSGNRFNCTALAHSTSPGFNLSTKPNNPKAKKRPMVLFKVSDLYSLD